MHAEDAHQRTSKGEACGVLFAPVGTSARGLAPYRKLTHEAVEALRYRAEDIARSLTRPAIKEARSSQSHVGTTAHGLLRNAAPHGAHD